MNRGTASESPSPCPATLLARAISFHVGHHPEFAVRNGRIHGHSVYFETGHIIGPQDQNCTNRGSVSIEGGSAEAMRAVGNCPVPFHPGEHHSSWTIRRP